MQITCNDTGCPVILSSECVFYEGSALPETGINTNDSLQVALQKIEEAIANGSGGGGGDAIWGSITGIITNQTDLMSFLAANYLTPALASATYVPLSRNITINGVTQNLTV